MHLGGSRDTCARAVFVELVLGKVFEGHCEGLLGIRSCVALFPIVGLSAKMVMAGKDNICVVA